MRIVAILGVLGLGGGVPVAPGVAGGLLAHQVAAQRESAARGTIMRKGLGEMNPGTLKQTTLDPRTRALLRVSIADADKTEMAIQTLMGRDVAPRFQFIMERAPKLDVIDV